MARQGSLADAAASYLLSEKQMAQPVNPQLLAPCPSMELTAVGTRDEQVLCFRRNGHKVLSATQRKASRIQRIGWKPNGAPVVH